MKTAYLVLENGAVFQGSYFGVASDVIGEVVFATGMTGYLETLTDPSYTGQIVVQTFPLIGNYGIIPEDFESAKIHVNAYIVKDWCQVPSNFRGKGNLDTFFKEKGVTGLCGIDTRALTKMIRECGTMNGMIVSDPARADGNAIKSYKIVKPVCRVSVEAPYEEAADTGRLNVAVMDFGLKENIKRELIKRGCNLTVFPHDADAQQILSMHPDGVMLTNGPGDPEDNEEAIATIRALMKSGVPMFGICLGHQLLALANGFHTRKMKYGHRGANQAVKELSTGRVYITSQNHGYEVVSGSIDPNIARMSFYNVNDRTCEGIEYLNGPVFSVQFHPEACGGPKDSEFLFDRFVQKMEEMRYAAQ